MEPESNLITTKRGNAMNNTTKATMYEKADIFLGSLIPADYNSEKVPTTLMKYQVATAIKQGSDKPTFYFIPGTSRTDSDERARFSETFVSALCYFGVKEFYLINYGISLMDDIRFVSEDCGMKIAYATTSTGSNAILCSVK